MTDAEKLLELLLQHPTILIRLVLAHRLAVEKVATEIGHPCTASHLEEALFKNSQAQSTPCHVHALLKTICLPSLHTAPPTKK